MNPALRLLLSLSYRSGALRLSELLHRRRTKVLIYHGVTTRQYFDGLENVDRYQIPVSEFADQLRYLARYCNVISLHDFLLGRGLSPRRTNVVLTFDDGYENNYRNAVPLLRHYGLPATFALPTGFVLTRQPLYHDVVEYAVRHSPDDRVRSALASLEGGRALGEMPPRLALYHRLMNACQRISQESRERVLASAQQTLDVEADAQSMFAHEDYRPLTLQQLRDISDSDLFEIASHSVNHYLLSNCNLDTKRRELRESKRQLELVTGVPCTAFCVPGGAWDGELVDEAYAAGYRCVLSSDAGAAKRGQHILGRNCVVHLSNMHWFADLVRGPVQDVIRAARHA